MSHSSQSTRDEYGNKHEPAIASKMANLWEKKIGMDEVHQHKPGTVTKKTSPTTVVNSSGASVTTGVALSQAGTAMPSNKLKKTNTKEIVENFEKMAVIKDDNTPDGNVSKMVKKMSSRKDSNVTAPIPPKTASKTTPRSASKPTSGCNIDKNALYAAIDKVDANVFNASASVRELRAKVDAMYDHMGH